MKKILFFLLSIVLISCDGRSESERKAYVDSLFHVISSSPTIVASSYTLEDRLDACDKLIKEYPEYKEQGEKIKATIMKQIEERDAELY